MPSNNDSRFTKTLLGLMGVFLALVIFAGGAATSANISANEASREASKVATNLSVHEARQNGTLESIEARLTKQDKVLDELLRRSYSEHGASPP